MSSAQFYDQLADYYDLIFEDWEASMARQGDVLTTLLTELLPDLSAPMRILDAAAGIGTQSLPLARQGFSVVSRDLSPGAIARLRREANQRGLTIGSAVADMRAVASSVASPVDAVIAFDNSVPHLLTDEEILRAFQSFHEALRPGGVCAISVRDYAALQRVDVVHPYGVRWRDGVRHLPLQAWHWLSPNHYEVTFYVIVDEQPSPRLARTTTQYYAVSTDRLLELFEAAGFEEARRLDETIYQPILVARRPEAALPHD